MTGFLARFFELLYMGGWVMVPIVACSITAVAVCIERWRTFSRSKVNVEHLTARVVRLLTEDRSSEALEICRGTRGPVAKVLETGILLKDRPRDEMRTGMADVGKLEVNRLDRYIPLLGTLGHLSPLLGLLGTVAGMMDVFVEIKHFKGNVGVDQIAGGIEQALVTTLAGLTVAIVAVAAHHYFARQIDQLVNGMELAATELLDVFRAKEERSPTSYGEGVESTRGIS